MAATIITDPRELDTSVCYYTTKELSEATGLSHSGIINVMRGADIDYILFNKSKLALGQKPTGRGTLLIHPSEAKRLIALVKCGAIKTSAPTKETR